MRQILSSTVFQKFVVFICLAFLPCTLLASSLTYFNQKFGYINQIGEYVIEPIYTKGLAFSQGRTCVTSDMYPHTGGPATTGWGVINRKGETILPFVFAEPRSGYSEGLIALKYLIPCDAARIYPGLGYYDIQGKLVIKGEFSYAGKFSCGLAAVRMKESKLIGFINKLGELVIKPRFKWGDDFSDGLALVGINDNKYMYINTKGEVVTKLPCYPGRDCRFVNGRALIQTGVSNPQRTKRVYTPRSYFVSLIDRKGNTLAKFQDVQSHEIFSEGLATLKVFPAIIADSRIIDRAGKTIFYADNCSKLSDGLMSTAIGFANNEGDLVIVPTIWDLKSGYSSPDYDFTEGLAPVHTGCYFVTPYHNAPAFGYIDKEGDIAILPKFSTTNQFSEGLALVGTLGSLEGLAYFERGWNQKK